LLILNTKYLLLALLLFVTEVVIALFIQDAFIRPYGGDFLVVILLYCMIKGLVNSSVLKTGAAVLAFSYLIETLQYFQFVKIMGLNSYPLANTIMGTSFAWWDMVAYTLGIVTVIAFEIKSE